MVVGGWHLVMEYASDGHQKKICIICLCFFVLFYIHQREVAVKEGTPEVIFVDAKFSRHCDNAL